MGVECYPNDHDDLALAPIVNRIAYALTDAMRLACCMTNDAGHGVEWDIKLNIPPTVTTLEFARRDGARQSGTNTVFVLVKGTNISKVRLDISTQVQNWAQAQCFGLAIEKTEQ